MSVGASASLDSQPSLLKTLTVCCCRFHQESSGCSCFSDVSEVFYSVRWFRPITFTHAHHISLSSNTNTQAHTRARLHADTNSWLVYMWRHKVDGQKNVGDGGHGGFYRTYPIINQNCPIGCARVLDIPECLCQVIYFRLIHQKYFFTYPTLPYCSVQHPRTTAEATDT